MQLDQTCQASLSLVGEITSTLEQNRVLETSQPNNYSVQTRANKRQKQNISLHGKISGVPSNRISASSSAVARLPRFTSFHLTSVHVRGTLFHFKRAETNMGATQPTLRACGGSDERRAFRWSWP